MRALSLLKRYNASAKKFMPKLPVVTPKQLIRVLLRLGFFRVHTKGSHVVFDHNDGRKTVVPMHSRDIPKGTLLGILKDIQISKEVFIQFLRK